MTAPLNEQHHDGMSKHHTKHNHSSYSFFAYFVKLCQTEPSNKYQLFHRRHGVARAGGGEVGEQSSACENPPLLPVPAEVAPASETSALGRSGR
ncbi:hypothetical protein E2C01_029470 [Portunus trituberculatus]|uniref:Uncharacterized protein n=1 Tax=Portunus trituberculatus TaxID=210409 RepID=A0A5B7ES16_PORTR|nr:hypothetical protein [Portunus trituberculatus]